MGPHGLSSFVGVGILELNSPLLVLLLFFFFFFGILFSRGNGECWWGEDFGDFF